MNDREPWDRQKGETKKAFEAFTVYRDLGTTRSLAKVANKLDKSKTIIGRWSSKWNWVERTNAWDDELDRLNKLEQIEEVKKMAERHAKTSMMFQQKVIERLAEVNPGELSPNDLARWFEVAVKIERLSRGEPTENVNQEIEGQVEVSNEVAKQIIEDEEASNLAHELLGRIAEGESSSNGVSNQSEEMDSS